MTCPLTPGRAAPRFVSAAASPHPLHPPSLRAQPTTGTGPQMFSIAHSRTQLGPVLGEGSPGQAPPFPQQTSPRWPSRGGPGGPLCHICCTGHVHDQGQTGRDTGPEQGGLEGTTPPDDPGRQDRWLIPGRRQVAGEQPKERAPSRHRARHPRARRCGRLRGGNEQLRGPCAFSAATPLSARSPSPLPPRTLPQGESHLHPVLCFSMEGAGPAQSRQRPEDCLITRRKPQTYPHAVRAEPSSLQFAKLGTASHELSPCAVLIFQLVPALRWGCCLRSQSTLAFGLSGLMFSPRTRGLEMAEGPAAVCSPRPAGQRQGLGGAMPQGSGRGSQPPPGAAVISTATDLRRKTL